MPVLLHRRHREPSGKRALVLASTHATSFPHGATPPSAVDHWGTQPSLVRFHSRTSVRLRAPLPSSAMVVPRLPTSAPRTSHTTTASVAFTPTLSRALSHTSSVGLRFASRSSCTGVASWVLRAACLVRLLCIVASPCCQHFITLLLVDRRRPLLGFGAHAAFAPPPLVSLSLCHLYDHSATVGGDLHVPSTRSLRVRHLRDLQGDVPVVLGTRGRHGGVRSLLSVHLPPIPRVPPGLPSSGTGIHERP